MFPTGRDNASRRDAEKCQFSVGDTAPEKTIGNGFGCIYNKITDNLVHMYFSLPTLVLDM